MSNMNLSANGENFLHDYEQLKTDAYQDSAGVWTIGYGHTNLSGNPLSLPN